MTQKEILKGARTVSQCLEALRAEHDKLLDDLKSQDITVSRYKARLLKKNMEMIEHGFGEAQLIMAIATQLEVVENSTKELQTRIIRLERDNSWLSHELAGIRQKLQIIERDVSQFEEENRHLYFMNSMKQYDSERPVDEVNTNEDRPMNDPLIDLILNDEVDERNLSVVSSSQFARPSNGDYETALHSPTLHKLVIHYARQGSYEIAAQLGKLAVENLENTTGHDHPDVATMLNILALVRRDQGNYENSERLLKDALVIREKTLGNDHPALAATLNNLAVLYGKIGRYEDAEVLGKRALKICENVYGLDHPVVAKRLNNVALVCQNVPGMHDEAEKYYKRALKIYECKLSPDDSSAVITKKNLASFYHKLGKYRDAEILYKQILGRAREKEFAQDDADNRPIWQIAEKREENKRRKNENERHGKYDSWHDAANINSQTVSVVLKNLAALYRRQEKFVAAETLEDCSLISALK